MSNETPPPKNRTPPEHAPPGTRTTGLSSIAATGWRIWRCHSIPSFETSTEQLRLVLLGTILMCFAVLTLMDPVLDAPIPGYVEGSPALFGGSFLGNHEGSDHQAVGRHTLVAAHEIERVVAMRVVGAR